MDVINKEKILEHAKKLVAEGKFDRAIVEFQHLLKADPDDLRVKIKMAELFVKRKQIQEAIKMYREVAEKYSEGAFYLKAVTVYRSILRLNPALLDINRTLGELYEKMGLVQDALYQYQIVSNSLEQKNDSQGMLEIREKMSSLNPYDISMKFRLAETYQIQGDVDKAMEMYESLAKQMKEPEEAESLMEIYSKILAYRPERFDLLKKICNMHYKRGEWKEIVRRLDAQKEFVAKDEGILRMQGDVYARLNQIETSKSKFFDLADLYIRKGKIENALKAYEDILFWGPEEEEHVVEEIEKIKPGASIEVLACAEKRRKKAQDAQEATIDEPSEPSVGGEASPSGDVKKLLKDANASYELAAAYKKMGLADESKSELGKAKEIYERLVAEGAGENVVKERLAEMMHHDTSPKMSEPKKVSKPKENKPSSEPTSKKKISFV